MEKTKELTVYLMQMIINSHELEIIMAKSLKGPTVHWSTVQYVMKKFLQFSTTENTQGKAR